MRDPQGVQAIYKWLFASAHPMAQATTDGTFTAEDTIESDDLSKHYQQSTFAGHFIELGDDRAAGEVWVCRLPHTQLENYA